VRSLLIGLISIIAVVFHAAAFAQLCYESTVQSPRPFLGNTGEIVRLADGSLWEVKYAYENLYEYHPTVLICPRTGTLMVKNRMIDVLFVSSGASTGRPGQSVIESTLVGKFEGLKAGNTYTLANGQVWEQIEPWNWISAGANPSVTIYPATGGHKMKVQNIERSVLVRRVK
jgi:hypothetical protein